MSALGYAPDVTAALSVLRTAERSAAVAVSTLMPTCTLPGAAEARSILRDAFAACAA